MCQTKIFSVSENFFQNTCKIEIVIQYNIALHFLYQFFLINTQSNFLFSIQFSQFL